MTTYTEEQIWDCYNGLLLGPDTERIRKLLVRYELFKLSLDIPGDIVECGVFKGAGLFYWAKLLKVFAPASRKRVIGLDTFGSFADSLLPYERETARAYVAESGFEDTDPDILLGLARAAELGNVQLVPGDVTHTAAAYVTANPGFRISLLHLDLDAYHGTKAALEAFFPVVAPGGLVIFDEYGDRGWGESDAVDEYFAGRNVEIRTVPHASRPTAYLIKR